MSDRIQGIRERLAKITPKQRAFSLALDTVDRLQNERDILLGRAEKSEAALRLASEMWCREGEYRKCEEWGGNVNCWCASCIARKYFEEQGK